MRPQCWLAPFCLFITLTEVAGDETTFRYPLAVAATDDEVVYVADRQLPGIWKIDSGSTTVFFQASKTFQTPLNAIRCLTIDHNGQLLAGDSSTRNVYRFDDSGNPTPLANRRIGIPMSLATTMDGTIYVADLELHRIWQLPTDGTSQPTEVAAINSPRGLTLDEEGNLLVLSTSSRNGQIQKIQPDGTVVPFIEHHPFRLPHKIVRGTNGWFYVSDNYNRCIWRVSPDGECHEWLQGKPLDRPVGLCRLHDDFLITDPHIKTIFRATLDKSITVFAASSIPSVVSNDE